MFFLISGMFVQLLWYFHALLQKWYNDPQSGNHFSRATKVAQPATKVAIIFQDPEMWHNHPQKWQSFWQELQMWLH
jgi:hypothetical protein